MLRFTLPYILFVSLTALAGSVLNSHRRFAVAAFTPVLLNVVMIVFAGWVGPLLERPALGLAAGVFVAGVVQLAFQLPFLRGSICCRGRACGSAHEGVRRIFKLMLPAIFGSSVAQISILLDTLIASFLLAGSISWLYYSDRLVEFPLGVFGIALATVILPRLSEQHAMRSPQTFSATLDWALELVLVIGVAGRHRARAARRAAARDVVPARRVHAARRRDGGGEPARLRAGARSASSWSRCSRRAISRARTRARRCALACKRLTLGMALSVAFVLVLLRTGWAPAHAGIAAATACSALVNAALLLAGLEAAERVPRRHRLARARVARRGGERRDGARGRRRPRGRRRLVRHEPARRAPAVSPRSWAAGQPYTSPLVVSSACARASSNPVVV